MTNSHRIIRSAVAGALILALGAPAAEAADVYLIAQPFTKTLRDGSGATGAGSRAVRMWGYSQCDSAWQNCGATSSPGPTIVLPDGDSTLRVHLRNRLPTDLNDFVPNATAFLVPGLRKQLAPASFTDGPFAGRIRSFDVETPRTGAASDDTTYTFADIQPGTYMYQSGTHPQVQVQMGLYGVIVKNAGQKLAYAGVPFTSDQVVVFSEVDPALHDAVDPVDAALGTTYGTTGPTSTVRYAPKFFLINGQPFIGDTGASGSDPIVNAGSGDRVLLRLVNAGIENHAPQLLNGTFDIVAEDGTPAGVVRTQYNTLLAAGKRLDVMFKPTSAGTYMLYDRRLRTVNNTATGGGMMARLRVNAAGGNQPPVAGPDFFYNVVLTGSTNRFNTGAPGVLANDSDPNGAPIVPVTGSVAGLTVGAVLLSSTGNVRFDAPAASWLGDASFTYRVRQNYPGIPTASQLVSTPATVHLVRDISGAAVYHTGSGGSWQLNGANRALEAVGSISASIIQNPATTNVCTLAGRAITAAPVSVGGPGNLAWAFTGPVAFGSVTTTHVSRCRVEFLGTIPAQGDVPAHTARVVVPFTRVTP
jgi:FtsP/CotA-like multicopper oxidase with cupredoxin domain